MTAVRRELQRLVEKEGSTTDPAVRGPVPLNRYYEAGNAMHVALPHLTTGSAAAYLVEFGYLTGPDSLPDLWGGTDPLAGLLFRAGDDAIAFVNASDTLARRRFTAAHELGHAVLHRALMGPVLLDAKIDEADGALAAMEAEANRFAAELLMPEVILRARAEELRSAHGCCPRMVLGYRLASELLVSNEAIGYRLKNLGVGDGE